jgi:hypothetical protein
MKRNIILLMILLSFSCVTTSNKITENKTPEKKSLFPYEPPAGYDWKYVSESLSWILHPENWTYKKQVKDEVTGIFMIKTTGKNADTKITINIIRRQKSPKPYVGEIHSNFTNNNSILESFKNDDGKFSMTRSTIKIQKDNYFIRILLQTYINQKTNSIYIIIYETPEKEWNSNWRTFDTVLTNLNLSNDF